MRDSQPAPPFPRVSVIMPTYNQAQFLPYALDSILHQTYTNFELIVVNDGSTDHTADVLEQYQQKKLFHVIHQENAKLPRALNAGFSEARGEYLTWTSSDNVMLPKMLETLVQALDENANIGMVYADWEVIDEEGALLGQVKTFDFDRFLLMRFNFINACFLYRRSCMEEIGLYDPEFIYAEDWEYWYRISQHFPIARIPKMLYRYRVHGGSLTEKKVLSQANQESKGYKKLVQVFKAKPWVWYYSKLKYWQLKMRLGQDPQMQLQNYSVE